MFDICKPDGFRNLEKRHKGGSVAGKVRASSAATAIEAKGVAPEFAARCLSFSNVTRRAGRILARKASPSVRSHSGPSMPVTAICRVTADANGAALMAVAASPDERSCRRRSCRLPGPRRRPQGGSDDAFTSRKCLGLDVLTNVLLCRLADRGFVSSMAMRFSDEERALAIRALDRLDMVPQALHRAGTLSGGQQQRVAIARALVQRPRIMLADEPIASLDPGNATRVMEALRTINAEDGLTVLVNLQTLDTARAYCHRIIVKRAGRVMFDGSARQLTDDVVRDIYGAEGLAEFHEAMTSTAIRRPGARVPA